MKLIEDTSHRVDEYQVHGVVGETTTVVTLQAEYDRVAEIIESVLVTGPATTNFTLQLGQRFWALSTNAQGFCILAPLKFSLKYQSPRILTGASAGDWTLELMGYADYGYRFGG